ncbi:DUF6090 family protein [Ichthyenterobacterium sp. W332]|uniref:DUF6090 family protein n=1 Tax=Microcosmobacter mediterraneus TaxID=3075607 RepID=A0ABU2YJI5_9FLAO|nr:DUF6090 family protein [Ichthyenterobacterium sp. W332]MDT0558338.1 DUF6090 family protein [Ichthyenterobacterium sp. W332]
MIKFFRKIRYDLMEKNKTGKYFKYAIGEIVLVVIGILIALQINTWNENRKNHKYEREVLLLINQNLKNDSIALSNELYNSNESNVLTGKLLEQLSLGNHSDSLNNWLGKIISFERFKSQSSAFEMLKSKGIDVISDNELQLALITYYDQSVHAVYVALNDVEESFKKDWEPLLKEDFLDFKWREYAVPIDSKAFFERQSTLSFLKLYRENRASSAPFIKAALDKISEIKRLSKKYIND